MTYDDDGFIQNPVLYNKNAEITRLRQRVKELEEENNNQRLAIEALRLQVFDRPTLRGVDTEADK